ncbi:hypothetical protein L7E35_004664 [Vibrio parahaemolyticus]|uniref:hypothetical protein n=1 Tax=Vibrio furnissii TaxID=29494 RepID=UPI001EEAD769|nr:hypothetical protein [Vibrio furnissii]EHZ2727068.1 hypothetical protein [Vibrio parahaemolyticus]EIV1599718.1 hypothetical protein [Vibrio parahaemolyticus]MCG6268574.1 hypothetical protein [Vibrio furnissii]
MYIFKNKDRKAEIDYLKLKHFIELTVSLNAIKSTNILLLSKTRLNNKRIVKALNELKLINKKQTSVNNYQNSYYISKELEELIYSNMSKSEEFIKYITKEGL